MISIQTYTGGIAATNGYLLENESGGKVLIDAPEGIAEWLDFHGARIEALLLTHQHFDHILGAAEVVEGQTCPVYAFGKPSPELTLETLVPLEEIPPYPVDHVLEGQSHLKLGETWEFEVIHVPGHSPDSLCYLLAEEGLLFAGDTLFRRGIGRFDFPHSDGELLLRGIFGKLLTLPETTKVYPGHMEPTTIGEEKAGNPYLQGNFLG